MRSILKFGFVWYVTIDQSGEYQFELRCWPRESEATLQQSLPEENVMDGVLDKGVGLPIKAAKILIGDQEKFKRVDDSDEAITFAMNLDKGETTIQIWFPDENENEICEPIISMCNE